MHEFILHLGFLLTLEFKQPSYLTVYIKALDEKEMCIWYENWHKWTDVESLDLMYNKTTCRNGLELWRRYTDDSAVRFFLHFVCTLLCDIVKQFNGHDLLALTF